MKISLPCVCLALLLLAGCGGKDQDTGVALSPPPADARDYDEARVVDGRLLLPDEDGKEVMLAGVFYFDYDEAIVRREGHGELALHARALAANKRFRVRLEGHADERGTREYNLALGERRAKAVGAFLLAQGAGRGQFEPISFGEEKPADPGHSEAAWARNRRVQIIYE